MQGSNSSPLSQNDIDHFLNKGYVVIHECFSQGLAEAWTNGAFRRLGYDPDNPATWEREIVHMPSQQELSVPELAPKAWAAACQLLGGDDRIVPSRWGDSMIANFHMGADHLWQPPSPSVRGWHKDGDFFRHFLDSPEQGLLTIVIWSDIMPRGGGTFMACDSVSPVARLLEKHPEGLPPHGAPEASFGSLVHECRDFVELTGSAGDVALIHPFLLHASSQNHSGVARFITNPPFHLKEPMRFNRDNADDFSPVERAILPGIGRDSLDFRPTAPRERIVSEGMKRKQKMLDDENARLAPSSS